MKTENEPTKKVILRCEELIREEEGRAIIKKMIVKYDLSPLKKIIESGGLDELIDGLRVLYTEIVEASLISYNKGEGSIFENNSDLVNQLFYLKTLADCFEEIHNTTYKRKKFPVVELDFIK